MAGQPPVESSSSSIGARQNYRVSYNPADERESSLWIAVKHKRAQRRQTNRIVTTRYNILTFLPKNLFQQFRRVANVYFAILIALNWVPAINALSKRVGRCQCVATSDRHTPDSAAGCLHTADGDSGDHRCEGSRRGSQTMEKRRAYQQTTGGGLQQVSAAEHLDNERRSASSSIRSVKRFVQCRWEDLSVGDIVRVRVDQTVPADILLLSSASSEGTCFLDTAAIDGETNLKQKVIPACFLDITKPEESKFELQCERPNDDIYHFNGRLVLSPSVNVYSCDNSNVLLRGCVLRITDHIDGLIVYAGNQTKIIQSSRTSSSKHALIEQYINRDVICSSVILTFLCLLAAGLSLRWERSFDRHGLLVSFLVGHPLPHAATHFFVSALRFVILFQVMVPIALYVSLDIVRVLQMYRIGRDKNLKYDRPISCRTFTINEDLGQIGYVFSDKTGTITQNKLVFKSLSIGGVQYSHR